MAQSVRLGAFVVTILAILGIFVFMIGSTESKFQANYSLRAQFPNVSGLDEGADVRVGGLHKGAVRKIEVPPTPEGKMTVVMDLARQTQGIVRKDSIASIKTEGLVGNKYVEISFGSKDSPQVRSGDTIASEPPLDISDLLAKTNQILDSTKSSLDNVQSVTRSVDAIATKINTGKGTVGALINDKSVYQEANAGATALREDADALKHNFLLRGYFNKRGFADPLEIRKHSIAQPPPGEPVKVYTFNAEQIFDKPDSVKLKNQKLLNEAGQFIEGQNPVQVVIEASAGPKGDSDKDRELSDNRAYVVRGYLLDHFKLEDTRLKILGLGKTEGAPSLRILVYSRNQSQGRSGAE